MAENVLNGVTNLDYQVKPQQSFINRAVALHYNSESNEQVHTKLFAEYPSYEECDTTLETPYDSKFKEYHTDRPVELLPKSCLRHTVAVVQDVPMVEYPMCCCTPCVPPKEKVFIRTVREYETPEVIQCDGRVRTIVTNHYAFQEGDEVSDAYYGEDTPSAEHKLITDTRVLEGVTVGSEVKGITITEELAQTVAEQRKKAKQVAEQESESESQETPVVSAEETTVTRPEVTNS